MIAPGTCTLTRRALMRHRYASASRMLRPVSATKASSRARPAGLGAQRRGGALDEGPAVVDDSPSSTGLRAREVMLYVEHVGTAKTDRYPE